MRTFLDREYNSYQISDDLCRRNVQVLERRYGGRIRAHIAATRIQRAFRQYRLFQQWQKFFNTSADGKSERTLIHSMKPIQNQAYSKRIQSHHRSLLSMKLSDKCSPSSVHDCDMKQDRAPLNDRIYCNKSFKRSQGENSHSSDAPDEREMSAQGDSRVREDNCDTCVWIPRSLASNSSIHHLNAMSQLGSKANEVAEKIRFEHSSSELLRRRRYRIALNFFNKRPARGIQFLVEWGFVQDSASALAKFLISRRGLSKQMIGEYLGSLSSQFNAYVLKCFMDKIDFYGMEIDIALRHTLKFFRLPGEAQKIERIMQAFSDRYFHCNRERVKCFHFPDTVFILSFAIIMLNTDLHSPCIKPGRKMKVDEFIKNLRGIDGGHDIDHALLTRIYHRIRKQEFRAGVDHVTQVHSVDHCIIGKEKPKLVEPQRRLVCYCRLNQVAECTRRQALNSHQRDVFLFNDLILITKVLSKRKVCTQYKLRWWSSLMDVRIRLFESVQCPYGLSIRCADDREFIFNATNENDRRRFIADVLESIHECREMEAVRIDYELDKHSLSIKSDKQRDSGIPEVDFRLLDESLCRKPSAGHRLSFNSFDSGVVEESSFDIVYK